MADNNYKEVANDLFETAGNIDFTKEDYNNIKTNLIRYYNSGDPKFLNEIRQYETRLPGLRTAIRNANTDIDRDFLTAVKDDNGNFDVNMSDTDVYMLIKGNKKLEDLWEKKSPEERREYLNKLSVSNDYVNSLQRELNETGDEYAMAVAERLNGMTRAEAEHTVRETYNNPTVIQLGKRNDLFDKIKSTKNSEIRNLITGKQPQLYLTGNSAADIDKAFGKKGILDPESDNYYDKLPVDLKEDVAKANSMSIEELDNVVHNQYEQEERNRKYGGIMGTVGSVVAPRVIESLKSGNYPGFKDIALDMLEDVAYTVNPVTAGLNKGARIIKPLRALLNTARGEGTKSKLLNAGLRLGDNAANPAIMEGVDAMAYNEGPRAHFNVGDVLQGTATNFGMERLSRRFGNNVQQTIPEALSKGDKRDVMAMFNSPLNSPKNIYKSISNLDDVAVDKFAGSSARDIQNFDAIANKKFKHTYPKVYNEANLAREILSIRNKKPNKKFETIDDIYPELSDKAKSFIYDNDDFVRNTMFNTVYGNPFEPRPTTVLDQPVMHRAGNWLGNKFGDAHPEMANRVPVVGRYIGGALKSIQDNGMSDEEIKRKAINDRWSVILNGDKHE